MKKLFCVRYSGSWLGGLSLVFADDADQAIEIIKNHENTCNFKNVSVEQVKATGVVYNDNGDY